MYLSYNPNTAFSVHAKMSGYHPRTLQEEQVSDSPQ